MTEVIAPDTAARLARFRTAHPDISVSEPETGGYSYWIARHNGMILDAEKSLDTLLDTLTWIFT